MESKMFAFGLFMLFYIVQSSVALRCYFCDSASDPSCIDIIDKRLQVTSECEAASSLQEPICVKIAVGDDTFSYVNRDCISKTEYVDPCTVISDELKKENIPLQYCGTCDTDGCNSGNSVQLFSTLIVFGAIICTARLFV